VELAGVFVLVAVGVADERGLPVVMDVAVGDGDVVRGAFELGSVSILFLSSMRSPGETYVEETIVVVLVVVTVGGDINVVDPDVGGVFYVDNQHLDLLKP
jgi:hypothetical protein